MNNKNRKFTNEKYLNYIRSLPCAITGKCGVDPHHADVIGRQEIRNDYYTLPINHFKHIGNGGHITPGRLYKAIGEDPRDLIIHHLAMYIEALEGRYSPDMDKSCQYLTWRRKLIGKE